MMPHMEYDQLTPILQPPNIDIQCKVSPRLIQIDQSLTDWELRAILFPGKTARYLILLHVWHRIILFSNLTFKASYIGEMALKRDYVPSLPFLTGRDIEISIKSFIVIHEY
jgi:hypothetical protein